MCILYTELIKNRWGLKHVESFVLSKLGCAGKVRIQNKYEVYIATGFWKLGAFSQDLCVSVRSSVSILYTEKNCH